MRKIDKYGIYIIDRLIILCDVRISYNILNLLVIKLIGNKCLFWFLIFIIVCIFEICFFCFFVNWFLGICLEFGCFFCMLFVEVLIYDF